LEDGTKSSYENLSTGPERPLTRPCGIHESMPYSLLITMNGRPDLAAPRAQVNAVRMVFAVAR
jgi:hypothetical protein